MWQNAFVMTYNHLIKPFKLKMFDHARDFGPIMTEKLENT